MKKIVIVIFAAVFAIVGCSKQVGLEKEQGPDDTSQGGVSTRSFNDDLIYPVKTTAGFSKSKKYVLDVASASMQITEKSTDLAKIHLEYVWRYGQRVVQMDISLDDVPFRLEDDGRLAIEAQGIPGSVSYKFAVSWTVETVFSAKVVISSSLEASKLNLESDEIYLDIDGFSLKPEDKPGTWFYVDHILYENERFINSMDSEITIDLGKYLIDSPKKNTVYELAPVVLSPGEEWEFDFSMDYSFEDGYYHRLPQEIRIQYAGKDYIVNRETLVPIREEDGLLVPQYEIEREYFHYLDDGFLDIIWYPIYIFRITPDVLGLE